MKQFREDQEFLLFQNISSVLPTFTEISDIFPLLVGMSRPKAPDVTFLQALP